MAEQRNCVGLHNAGSCIVPVRDSAVHQDKQWAEQASLLSERRAREFPSEAARWLANLGRLLVGKDLDSLPEELALSHWSCGLLRIQGAGSLNVRWVSGRRVSALS